MDAIAGFVVVKKHGIHIKPKSYKFELLRELVGIKAWFSMTSVLSDLSLKIEYLNLYLLT